MLGLFRKQNVSRMWHGVQVLCSPPHNLYRYSIMNIKIESLTESQVTAIEGALATWVDLNKPTVPVVESPSESITMPKEVIFAGMITLAG